MTLLPGSKAAKIESLQAELAEANTNLELSEETRTGLENSLAALQAEVETLNASLTATSAELATVRGEFEEYQSGEEARSHAAAQTILAGIGEVPPIEEAGGEPGSVQKSLVEQMAEIKDPRKRAEFYAANKAEIRAEMIAG